jgi:PAS domain S-box-containing protein
MAERDLILIKAAFESSSDAIQIADLSGKSLYHNKAFERLFGYEARSLSGAGGFSVLFAEAGVALDVLDAVNAGRSWRGEATMKTRDGRLKTIALRADLILDDQAGPTGLIAVCTDITEHRMTEDLLRTSEDRYRDLVENSGLLIGTHDLEGKILSANLAVVRMAGYTRSSEFHGKKIRDFLEAKLRPLFASYMQALLREGHAEGRMKVVLPSGESRVIEYTNSLRAEGPGPPTVRCIARDVTAQVMAERSLSAATRQIAQSERLAWLGQMIAGAAHELRDPLNRVVNFALVLRDSETDINTRDKLDVVVRAGQQAAEIVSDLVSFASQRHDLNSVEIDLIEVLDRALAEKAEELAAAGISVLKDIKPVPKVKGDERLLQRVFLNIIVNAEQAMASVPGQRILTISVLPGRDESAGRVIVKIGDTGPGVPADDLASVFDPFFTTKPVGQAMGLGLSFSYGVIEMHGGAIRIENVQGAGARIIVELPFDGGTS